MAPTPRGLPASLQVSYASAQHKIVLAVKDYQQAFQADQQMGFDKIRSLLQTRELQKATSVELWQLRLRPASNKQLTNT